jgi:hypothetical protein
LSERTAISQQQKTPVSDTEHPFLKEPLMSVSERLNPHARSIITLGLIAVVAVAVFYLSDVEALKIGISFCFLLLAVAANVLVVRIYLRGPGQLPIIPFVAGALFVVGGAAIDIIATTVHDPSLTQEGNPIVRAFLDAGFSVPFVYGFGAVGQTLFVLLICLLWAGFFRHIPEIVESALAENPKNSMEFIKAAGGSGHLTWRQWIIPFKMSELPKAYHTLWLIAVMGVGSYLGHWYLGLRWLGLIPQMNGYLVTLIGIAIATTIYFLWLARQYQRIKE